VERIASLLPSATEIACALGLRDQLVGRSHECDFPPGVESLPVLTEPKLDPAAPSAAIDARVRELVREGLSVYRVDAQKLRELAPTLILTQDHCEACAASPADVEAALAEWTGGRPRVLSLRPLSLGDVWVDLERVAEAAGVPGLGNELAARLSLRLSDVGERAIRLRERPRVACLEWIEPLMASGNWMPELVTIAGGRSLLADPGAHSRWIDLDELAAADPDVVVVLPCGFTLERTRAELPALAALPGFRALRAVREGRVFLADGHHYMNRPGPRLVESLEILAEILHPDVFAPRHRGSGWEPWSAG
jgi:iron complex transport system substrate-binding protein